ncbi:beta strand repeat-containing protein [Pseudomarimonas salicorniae]|uniref:Big-1 domain-containing protein n=1 Tax=Pseudomarimonas salicorniae TaxID=2933270 RepID=A0ABT0GJ48_9GAMM|nr:hypothetical protein [Lysobacter sp. CAU 1642]MCK7594558.1 hypothetical protein [Lysobacter sp. CAU 1642]
MKLSNAFHAAVLLAGSMLLAACGGGGGSGNDSGFNPPGINVSASAASNSVQSGRPVNITVTVRQAGGAAIQDGTQVTGVVAPANVGSVVALGPNGPLAGSTATTVGGVANFRFTGGAVGTATVTFSVADPSAPSRNVTATVTLTVTQGIDRLTLESTRLSLPANTFNVAPFFGSPYMSEVTITLRTASGELVNATNGVQVSVNPVGNTGGFSTLDDAATPENEFLVRLGQGPVDVVAGKATVFLHSLNFTGQTTMTVTGQDPETGETVSASQVYTIVASSPALPATVSVSPTAAPQYVQSSGGNTSGRFDVQVTDGNGETVPNPVSGNNAFNNVRLELIGDANGARLSGTNASGQAVSGTAISVRTTNGIAGAVLISGNVPGNVQIRATADRADNNVDNGISDAVFSQRTIAISDGVMFDIDITQPTANALFVNRVSDDVTTPGGTVPPDPDGTYSLVISAIATDRLGNPVLPGTTVSFGLIDEPQLDGLGTFLISGNDGDPQEGGRNFSAPGGAFTTAGGGAGPGDALVLFGEEVTGNRDHESARRISAITSRSTLTVDRRFNHNDTTGSIVNSGPVLPYVIGRAADGNIVASGTTDERGVVTVRMNYPVSKLGKVAIIWAQGDGDIVANAPETVGDVEFTVFAGVADAVLSVSPTTIPGNTTTSVAACVVDALGSPISGIDVGFSFVFSGGGTGSVDGVTGSGGFASPTDSSGCTTGSVTTSAVVQNGSQLRISAVGQTINVNITVGSFVLTANPSFFFGGGGVTTLRLVDDRGNPVAGVQLSGTCTGSGGAVIGTAPDRGQTGVTDANGQARFAITTERLNQNNAAGSGTCTYSVPSGQPSATVRLQGVDLCDAAFSPPNPGCGP